MLFFYYKYIWRIQHMSKENKRHETVYVGSMELLQELAKKNALHNLKTVKFKDGYPLFGFVGVPKVTKIINEFSEAHSGDIEHTADDVSLWKAHSEFITQNVKDTSKVVTRNMSVLKQIVLSGNVYRINKVFTDKSGKRVYRFFSCPEIEKIKVEGDKISHERWKKKHTVKETTDEPINNTMKDLIEKAMAEVKDATE